MMSNHNLLVLGFIAGFFSAALGIGGGAIIVIALALFFSYDIKRSIGTSLATIVPTAFVGIITHYIIQSNNIKLLVVLYVAIGSVTGAKFGAGLANRMSNRLLTRLFALLLVFIGLKLTGMINFPTEPVSDTNVYPLLIILGLIAGSASALFGIGGGVIMVPVLNLFFGLSIHEAVATSLTIILPTTLAGVMFHKKFNNINTEATKFLIPASLIGAVFGAIAANNLPSDTLKVIFGIFMILCAIKIYTQEQ